MLDAYELVQLKTLEAKNKADEARKIEQAANTRLNQFKVLQYLMRCGFMVAYDESTHGRRLRELPE